MGGECVVLYWRYGFGVWLRSGFGVWFFTLEIDYAEEQRTKTLEKILKGIKKKRKTFN